MRMRHIAVNLSNAFVGATIRRLRAAIDRPYIQKKNEMRGVAEICSTPYFFRFSGCMPGKSVL